MTDKSVVVGAQMKLEQTVGASSGTGLFTKLHQEADETFATVPDRDVACALLLRTVSCLSQKQANGAQLNEFIAFLKDQQSCAVTVNAKLSVDGIVEIADSGAAPTDGKGKPITMDLFVRNSGDTGTVITRAILRFDEPNRPDRAPADIQPLTGIYSVLIGANDSVISGGGLNSPVNAYYPGPGVHTLIVDAPLAQRLPARSTDRFRLAIQADANVHFLGPMKSVRVEVMYDGVNVATSTTLMLTGDRGLTQ